VMPASVRLLVLVTVLAPASIPAQKPVPYATKVIAYQPGKPMQSPFTDPKKALGAPRGGRAQSGSTDVVSLGPGGSLTLGFDLLIANRAGADFIVFENAFTKANTLESFAEVFFVEVSSNGKDFARFPSSYVGPDKSLGPYATYLPGTFQGLGGATPVFANPPLYPAADPRDPARAGGEAFDLSALADDPLVKANKVNLMTISHIRLVDIVDGQSRDSHGRWIHDPSAGSADIDAVAVLHFLMIPNPHAPRACLRLTPARRVQLELRDPDGWKDLDPSRLFLSIQGIPLDFFAFASLTALVSADATGFVLETPFSFPKGLPIKLSASVRDYTGTIEGSTIWLH